MLKDITQEVSKEAEAFLALGSNFKLGDLQTEQQAPETIGLAENAKTDLKKAVNQNKALDIKTIAILKGKINELEAMYLAISKTFEAGNRVFICGCGATGRLSLALEQLFRQEAIAQNKPELLERVVSFMSGGDLALIKSVEDFEDHPEYAVQHMKDIGYKPEDLLISSTEGGETPWVIGATNYAAEISSHKPFFLYCNPDEVLKVPRSQEVIANKQIIKINLTVGPMGITGSTRMQSTTILMYAIGLALLHVRQLTGLTKEQADSTFKATAEAKVNAFAATLQNTDVAELLAPLTQQESQIYTENGYIFYETTPYFGLSVLTDTTERSPTFSLFPFENQQDIHQQDFKPSLCHLVMLPEEGAEGDTAVERAWFKLLGGRTIRGLDSEYWTNYVNKVATKRALGYNFSPEIVALRKAYTPQGSKHYFFAVQRVEANGKITLKLNIRDDSEKILVASEFDLTQFNGSRLCESIYLKVLLNAHSTLVMCRLDKVKSNIMIWVRPSNLKLIDRSIRYVQYFINDKKELLQATNPEAYKAINYSLICHALMSETHKLNYGQAIVLNTYARILNDLFNLPPTA